MYQDMGADREGYTKNGKETGIGGGRKRQGK